jgi:Uma2 family endonuclease
VEASRWAALEPGQRVGFAPLCPCFVAELLAPTDDLAMVRGKLAEYVANGARLGWLTNPLDARVEIFRPGCERELLEQPVALSGENVLPGFRLDLTEIL